MSTLATDELTEAAIAYKRWASVAMMDFGVHPLRRLRELCGLSLRQLSSMTDIDHVRLHRFELGLRPTADEVFRITTAIGPK